ncbi:MAG: ATP-binding protein [Prochloraceae cyanobacterium]
MKVSLHNSLKFRMPSVVLAGIVPLMLVAIFYASDRAATTIRQEATENIKLKTKILANSVLRWEESNILALINLSVQPDIINMNPTEQKPVLEALVDKYQHFYLAMTINKDGWSIARNDNKKPKYYRDRDYVEGALQGNDITYQTIISRTINKPALCISTPIRQAKLIVGVTAICTDLQALSEQVGQLQFGETGYAFVVDKSGKVLAHTDPEYLVGDKLKDLSYYPPVNNFLAKKNDGIISSFQESDGLDWITYYVSLDNGWGVIVVQQKTEFLHSEQRFENLAFFVAGVTVIGVSLLTWILANHLIAPISNLTDAASAIADGQFDRQIKLKRQDELGILANSFNRMAAHLKSLFQNLEKRIEQRTAQLKQAKEAAERAKEAAERAKETAERAKETAERAKETAEAANKSKDRFLANITHELRTPLNSILGYAKILQRDTNLNPSQLQNLRIVQHSGTHLLTLINDILDFSKTKAGKIELYPTKLHLPSFLDGVLDLVRMWSQEKGLELRYETDNNLPIGIQADEKRLRQVLINLLSNGIKFTSEGEVTLKVSVMEKIRGSSTSSLVQQKLRFEVRDTGMGMSPQESKKIFQPFEQVGDVQSRAAGTGLGLSLSKQLVELMGGELRVKSQLRAGSTFWFDVVFPIVEVVVKAQEDRTDEILGYKGKRRKLLVVDDKQQNRQLLVKILKPIGFEVETAANGEQMLSMASSMRPDLILLDLFMPVKTGFTSSKELRQRPELRNIPIIVLSASAITDEMRQYLKCEAYMSKPIDEEKLLILLQEYLRLEWIYRQAS